MSIKIHHTYTHFEPMGFHPHDGPDWEVDYQIICEDGESISIKVTRYNYRAGDTQKYKARNKKEFIFEGKITQIKTQSIEILLDNGKMTTYFLPTQELIHWYVDMNGDLHF